MSVYALPALSSDTGLTDYLRAIKAFPVLQPEEEFMLAKRLQVDGDVEAAHRLVTSHLRLVVKMAVGYRHYGLPLADLISEGNLGLMRAVKKFDPDRGFRLATYAMWWIKAALHEYVLDSWSMVRVGSQAARKKLFFGLRKAKTRLQIADAGELSPDDVTRIAQDLDVPEAEVIDINRRISGRDSSLNAPLSLDSDMEAMDMLVDETDNQEVHLARRQEETRGRQLLDAGFQVLNEREKVIITERRLKDDPVTLEELGQRFGISRERVRQIENRAFQKMQDAVRAAAA